MQNYARRITIFYLRNTISETRHKTKSCDKYSSSHKTEWKREIL